MLAYTVLETEGGAAVCYASPFGGLVVETECPSVEAAQAVARRRNAEAQALARRRELEALARTERRCVRYFPNERGV